MQFWATKSRFLEWIPRMLSRSYNTMEKTMKKSHEEEATTPRGRNWNIMDKTMMKKLQQDTTANIP